MNLRRQLLLVSLLLLALPWAGCQFVREIEGALRQGQETALYATAGAAASLAASQRLDIFPAQERSEQRRQDGVIYAFPSEQPIIVDGYGDGWDDAPGTGFTAGDEKTPAATLKTLTRGTDLYLLLQVRDDDIAYHNPALPDSLNGDRLMLRLGASERPRDYVIRTAAPGSVRARPASRSARTDEAARISGYWQDTASGYTLELQLPIALAQQFLGLAIVDNRDPNRSAGNFDPDSRDVPPPLITRPVAASDLLAPFSAPGREVLLVDDNGWVLATSPSAPYDAPNPGAETFWLLQLFYRHLLAQDALDAPPVAQRPGKLTGNEVSTALAGDKAAARYREPRSTSRTLQSIAVPVRIDDHIPGAVVIRESGEAYLSLTDRAFSRLLGYSALAIGTATLGLLGYASILSWRIRRLSRAVDNAIGDDGGIQRDFRPSNRPDEIGDLSRHYAHLLGRVREYNEYLRTLSRKLSHELRTPIAVIQSSLDNLDELPVGDANGQAQYQARARDGLTRLQGILAAMSEASRLEESIRADELTAKDLGPMLRALCAAYRDVYPGHTFTAELPDTPAIANVAPDLLIQALDKIVDNAASFCPPGGTIVLTLGDSTEHWVIGIANDGPTLAQDTLGQLFDPMVSLREETSAEVHLGLGLHIVRLVTEFHHGRARAGNRPDGNGVLVTLELPKTIAQ